MKVGVLIIAAAIAYGFVLLWDMMSPGGASDSEKWMVGIITFIAAAIGLYFSSRLGGERA